MLPHLKWWRLQHTPGKDGSALCQRRPKSPPPECDLALSLSLSLSLSLTHMHLAAVLALFPIGVSCDFGDFCPLMRAAVKMTRKSSAEDEMGLSAEAFALATASLA
jgi:hypothetical protein